VSTHSSGGPNVSAHGTALASGNSQGFLSDGGAVGMLDGLLTDEAGQRSAAAMDFLFARPAEDMAEEQ
jgi:hypothetical protein